MQLFNTFDYYVNNNLNQLLSGILMIIQRPFLEMLLHENNIDEIRKKSNNQSTKEAYVEAVLFQSK